MIERGVRVSGLGIRVIDQGSGPPVLLVHGGTLGFSADMWATTMPPLAAAGYRVIAFDQPGYAFSDDPPDFALNWRRHFLLSLADALALDQPVLIGHSQAGGLVVGAALNAPDRFRGVVVMGTGSLLPPLEKAAGASSEGASTAAPAEPKDPDLAATRKLLESNLFHKDRITPDVLAAYHRLSIGRNFTNHLRREAAGTAKSGGGKEGKPLWQRLDELKPPAMLIYGANDRGQAASRVEIARKRFPKLDYHVLENCHHIIQWDRPDALIPLLTAFLARAFRA